jgi:hypothetical protein
MDLDLILRHDLFLPRNRGSFAVDPSMQEWLLNNYKISLEEERLFGGVFAPLFQSEYDDFIKAIQIKIQSQENTVLFVFAPQALYLSMRCLICLVQNRFYEKKTVPFVILMDDCGDNFFWSLLSAWPADKIQILGFSTEKNDPACTLMLWKMIDHIKENSTYSGERWQDRITLISLNVGQATSGTEHNCPDWHVLAKEYEIPLLQGPQQKKIPDVFSVFHFSVLLPGLVAGLNYDKIMSCGLETLTFLQDQNSNQNSNQNNGQKDFLDKVTYRLHYMKKNPIEKFYIHDEQLLSWAQWYKAIVYSVSGHQCEVESFFSTEETFNHCWVNAIQSAHGAQINFLQATNAPSLLHLPKNLYQYNGQKWHHFMESWSQKSKGPLRLFRLEKPTEESLVMFWTVQVMEGLLLKRLLHSLRYVKK